MTSPDIPADTQPLEEGALDELRNELKQMHDVNKRSSITKWILTAAVIVCILVGGLIISTQNDTINNQNVTIDTQNDVIERQNISANCRADALSTWADDVTNTLRDLQEADEIDSLRAAYDRC